MSHKRRTLTPFGPFIAWTALATTALAALAFAQTRAASAALGAAASAPAAKPDEGLQTISVTAQRAKQKLQNVPAALLGFDAARAVAGQPQPASALIGTLCGFAIVPGIASAMAGTVYAKWGRGGA